MELEFKIGDIVMSNHGHDKNRLFIVVEVDKTGYIAIIDGRYRPIAKPKHKNPKHLEYVAHDDNIINKVNSKQSTDAEIHKLIKAYREIKE